MSQVTSLVQPVAYLYNASHSQARLKIKFMPCAMHLLDFQGYQPPLLSCFASILLLHREKHLIINQSEETAGLQGAYLFI